MSESFQNPPAAQGQNRNCTPFSRALKAPPHDSPGQRPRNHTAKKICPERAAQNHRVIFVTPFQGFNSSGFVHPGRCPGLSCFRLSAFRARAKKIHFQPQMFTDETQIWQREKFFVRR
jgi:hypothetical protein